MKAREALKEAQRRWPGKGAVRDYGKRGASNPEARSMARDELTKLRALPAEDRKKHRKQMDELFSASMRERYRVGYISNIAGLAIFHVRGTGDTWDQCFAKADQAA